MRVCVCIASWTLTIYTINISRKLSDTSRLLDDANALRNATQQNNIFVGERDTLRRNI